MPGRTDDNPAAQRTGRPSANAMSSKAGMLTRIVLPRGSCSGIAKPVEGLLERGRASAGRVGPAARLRASRSTIAEHEPAIRRNAVLRAGPSLADRGPRAQLAAGGEAAAACRGARSPAAWSRSFATSDRTTRRSFSGMTSRSAPSIRGGAQITSRSNSPAARRLSSSARSDRANVVVSSRTGSERYSIAERRCADRGEGAAGSVRHDVPQRPVLGAGFEDRLRSAHARRLPAGFRGSAPRGHGWRRREESRFPVCA